MISKIATIILCTLAVARAQTAEIDAANVAEVKLVGAGGEVVDDATYKPSVGVQLTYHDTGVDIDVLPGVLLTRNQTATEPTVQLASATDIAGKGYLISIVDTDAPTPQDKSESQVKHWLAENLVAGAGASGLYTLPTNPGAVTPYIGPGPGDGSAPHRYTVLVYEQPTPQVTAPRGEANAPFRKFDIAAYAAKIQGLKLVGATFFRVGPYGTVPNNGTWTPAVGGTTNPSGTTGAPTGSHTTSATGTPTKTPDSAAALGASAFLGVVGTLFAIVF